MTVQDNSENEYSIAKGELREVNAAIGDYFIVLSSLPEKSGWVSGGLYVHSSGERKLEKKRWYVEADSYGNYCIGCRTFSPEVYAKILKAAGVKKARKKKAAKD